MRFTLRQAFLALLAALLLPVFAVISFVFMNPALFKEYGVEAFIINSASMEPSMQEGDYVLALKTRVNSFRSVIEPGDTNSEIPKRGDVVLFSTATVSPDSSVKPVRIFKRVIGLPGERVEIIGRVVKINGKPLPEPYVRFDEVSWSSKEDFEPYYVPNGHCFVLGDNRDHSRDSRFWESPFLKIDEIQGRAILTYWNKSGNVAGRFGAIARQEYAGFEE